MDEIRLGTIGSGIIVRSILDNVKVTDGIRLAAVYSRSEEKARALAAEYGPVRAYTNMDAFLADSVVNFVYIASPNLLHYEQTRRALLAGKNVICEKPFCVRAEQVRELTALAKAKRLFLVEAMPTAFLPNLEVLRAQLPKIGPVRMVLANYSQYSSRYDQVLRGEVPNVFSLDYAAGCLMDINVYNVWLNIALWGKPRDAVYYPNIREGLADTSGILIMRYDGFISQCAGAKDTWGINSFQIEGEKGYIYIADGSNGIKRVRVVTKTGDETFNAQPEPDRLRYEIQGITKLVLADDHDACYKRLDVTLDVIKVIEYARRQAGILFPGD